MDIKVSHIFINCFFLSGELFRLSTGLDVWYNGLWNEIPLCFLKTEFLPSQRIFEMPHKLWAIIEKTGSVKSSYGSCFAG